MDNEALPRMKGVDVRGGPTYRLDHVCLAVRQIDAARTMLERLFGYVPRTEPVVNSRQEVRVQFMSKEGSIDIKLIEPSSPQSPLVHFLKRSGGGLHHLAFRTESVETGVADLLSKGARVLTTPQSGEAFNDAPIAFVFAGLGLNVELVETDDRRAEVETPP